MIVFYSDEISEDKVTLSGDEHRHCVKTLRHKIGDEIKVFGKMPSLLTCIIHAIDRHEVIANIMDKKALPEIKHHLSLAIAPTKNADRLEWFVSKAVEIGVQQILIMNTDHTERSRYKLERLNRILVSAAKQSLNFQLPDLQDQLSFKEVMDIQSANSIKLIAHCNDPVMHINKIEVTENSTVSLLIGPEGDFSNNEITLAQSNAYQEISLGPSRLRTETAGVVAATLLNAKFQ